MPTAEVNVLALRKGPETFVCLWTDNNRLAAMAALGSWALTEELNFDEADYRILARHIESTKHGPTTTQGGERGKETGMGTDPGPPTDQASWRWRRRF
jgi:hypothetical protein